MLNRTRRSLLALLVVIASGVIAEGATPGDASAASKIDPWLLEQSGADPARQLPVIVMLQTSQAPFTGPVNEANAKEAVAILEKLHNDGGAFGALPIVNGAAGHANARGLNKLAKNDRVRFVFADRLIAPHAADDRSDTRPPGQIAAPYPRVVRADKVWLEGPTGRGVSVAVLDSGVAPHPDLQWPADRVLARVNFADPLAGLADPGGHGTHVAGIIAGNGTNSDLSKRQSQPALSGDADQVEYVGVAPAAGIVDVRVLNSNGYGRISSVIRGIAWVITHQADYDIRVINLSFGAPTSTSYLVDPLTAAVEIAWKRGIVVVGAAGNTGPTAGSVETPGIDPFAITVGALDDLGTLQSTDDELAWFSSWGTPLDARPKPDLVAPGRRIVSLRTPGSHLDTLFGDRVVTAKSGADYFRLTGTSMSTAVVSGVVALMLERQPALQPDEVKAILRATTQTYGEDSKTAAADPAADGAGLVDAYVAVNSPPIGLENQGLRPADGLAVVLYPILYGQPLSWNDPTLNGIDWDGLTWENLAWDNLAWENLAWDNLAWENLAWENLAWDNLAWDNLAWDGFNPANLAWDTLAALD